MHQRQAIRAAVVAALLNVTAAGTRVYPTRAIPYQASQTLPVISVYTLDEDVDSDSRSTAPRELTRNVSLTIEAWVSPGDNADNAIDALALQIETAMHADPYFGGAAADSLLTSTVTEVLEESDRQLGWLALTYEVTYRTDAPEAMAGGDMDDFNTAHAVHNLGNDVHEDDQAEDEITVQA